MRQTLFEEGRISWDDLLYVSPLTLSLELDFTNRELPPVVITDPAQLAQADPHAYEAGWLPQVRSQE